MLQLRPPHALPIRAPLERSPWNRNSLIPLLICAGPLGSALSMVVITVDGVLRPRYSAISDVISDLARPPYAWVLNKDLIATGLLFMLFAVGAHGAMGNALGRKGVSLMTALFLAAGAGIMSDGIFTEDKALRLHELGFYVAFSALTLAFFVVGARLLLAPGDHQRLRRYGCCSLITGVVVLALIINYVAVPPVGARFQGLIERLMVGAAFAWQCMTAYQFLNSRQRSNVVRSALARWARWARWLRQPAAPDSERTSECLDAA